MILIENKSASHYLFFIHGMLCDARDWQSQIDYFSKNYSICAYNLPGHGDNTEHTENICWDIPSLATGIEKVINTLDPLKKIILIGHSLATRIVIELASRVNKKIDSIILLDMGYQIKNSLTEENIEEEKANIKKVGYTVWLQEFFNVKFGETTQQCLRDAIMKKAYAIPEAIGIALYLNAEIYDYYALEKALRLISTPTLILQSSFYYQGQRQELDKHGNAKSDWLDLIDRTLPHAQIELIKKCGHWIMLEQADYCNRLINNFLYSR